MMDAYKVGQSVRVVSRYSGLVTVGTVVRVSPSGRKVSVELPRRLRLSDFWQRADGSGLPGMSRHFSEYDGYLFPSA